MSEEIPTYYFTSGLDDWDVIEQENVQKRTALGVDKSLLDSITEKIAFQVGRTMSNVTKAIGNFRLFK